MTGVRQSGDDTRWRDDFDRGRCRRDIVLHRIRRARRRDLLGRRGGRRRMTGVRQSGADTRWRDDFDRGRCRRDIVWHRIRRARRRGLLGRRGGRRHRTRIGQSGTDTRQFGDFDRRRCRRAIVWHRIRRARRRGRHGRRHRTRVGQSGVLCLGDFDRRRCRHDIIWHRIRRARRRGRHGRRRRRQHRTRVGQNGGDARRPGNFKKGDAGIGSGAFADAVGTGGVALSANAVACGVSTPTGARPVSVPGEPRRASSAATQPLRTSVPHNTVKTANRCGLIAPLLSRHGSTRAKLDSPPDEADYRIKLWSRAG